jgi:nucleoside-diphosphate-sugar epimerase
MKPVFIVGCGDMGRRVAALCRQAGESVFGLARSEKSAARLVANGIQVVSGDLADPTGLQDLPTAAADIYYFAPPPNEGETDPQVGHFLAAIAPAALPAKVVLISTTAVYGDCKGRWITEAQPVNPQTARGKRRLDAERQLRAWSARTGVPVVILRVGGIYGPQRLPLARLRQGLPILHEAESPYTNRIHEDDLARICVAAAERGVAGAVYNVSDGHPGTMSQYFKAVARACGLPPPPEVSLAEAQQVMSAGMLSYLQESRRLDNHKLLAELKVSLHYPSLADGLAALPTSVQE